MDYKIYENPEMKQIPNYAVTAAVAAAVVADAASVVGATVAAMMAVV